MMNTELRKRLEEAADKTNSVYINTRPSTDKEIAFKDEIKKKYHLSETTAELIAGRFELALMGQRNEILAQCRSWLETHIANHVETREAEGNLMTSKEAFLADFESDMSKLWED